MNEIEKIAVVTVARANFITGFVPAPSIRFKVIVTHGGMHYGVRYICDMYTRCVQRRARIYSVRLYSLSFRNHFR